MLESLVWGGAMTFFVGVLTALIVGIPSYLRQRRDETISVTAQLSHGGDLRLIERIGCAGLLLKVKGNSKRPAKIKGAKFCVKGRGFLRGFQEGFQDDFGHTPLSDTPEEELYVRLVPITPPSQPNTWILDRDDVCEFFLPIRLPGLPLFVEAPSENVTVRVEHLDDSEDVVLQGLSVQSVVSDLIDMWGNATQTLNVNLEIGVTVLSKTLPDMAHLVGKVNPQTVPMWKPRESIVETDNPKDGEDAADSAEQPVYSEVFDQERMQRCVDVYRRIHNNSAEKGVFDCCIFVKESLEGKTLDDLSEMRFWVGYDGDVTEMGFIDMLVVFKMFADQQNKRTEWAQTGDEAQQTFRICTVFSKTEAYALLREISHKIVIQLRQ